MCECRGDNSTVVQKLERGCVMAIRQSVPRRAFNLFPKCNESGHNSGHPNLIKNGRKSANDLLCPVEIHQFHMSK